MISKAKKEDLEKQGYRLVGNHSAVKVCMWTKECIRGKDVCYKNTFYGINTHQCVQMTPALHVCTHRCSFCWRDIAHTDARWKGVVDDPGYIIDEAIKEHTKYLIGFKGNRQADTRKFEESMKPRHFAISLSGEPTYYPKLPEMIDELSKRKLSSFLVTNGTNPEMIKKLIGKPLTQLYVTLPAPDKESYIKACKPLIRDGWEKIMETLSLLKHFKRSVIRLTLAKDVNMFSPEKYAEIIKKYQPLFVEAKAYMWVGFSMARLPKNSMVTHKEIVNFSKQIEKNTGYRIVDEKVNSRVTLLMKNDIKERVMTF